MLKAAGNPVHPTVATFLREFGGLKVTHPHRGLRGAMDSFHISPSAAMKYFPIHDDSLYDCNDRVGKALCAIGTASRDYMILLMDEDGKVYAACDDLMFFVGNSGTEALEALCAGAKLPPIP